MGRRAPQLAPLGSSLLSVNPYKVPVRSKPTAMGIIQQEIQKREV